MRSRRLESVACNIKPVAVSEVVDPVADAELGLEQVGDAVGLVRYEQPARADLPLEIDVVHDAAGDRLASEQRHHERDDERDPAHAAMEAKRRGRVDRAPGLRRESLGLLST